MPDIWIEPWAERDLELLRRVNTPEMKQHLGGPETDEQVLARHQRYLAMPAAGTGVMFSVRLGPRGDAAGTIGYWDRLWQDRPVHETGWSVLPEHQGRGIAAAAALAVVERLRGERRLRYLHAFPSVGNPASNAVCRRAGFTLVGECDFEYPAGSGHLLRSNDWRLDLEGGTLPPC
ncbi:N-acetyltransferase GCN5 [Streptomyces mashuensis]|uniref:N-acetyltransferase GCN5 n=1 Tax=Streptomyces mashuensis TaxID=33904 RepID=A0A919B6C0_9ACTN|nr:GNAT family N-acetyltransferase [Streptomyces mashuensis]GHF62987.1 N-acetyltransferase GCN5 [Streptomyces mashuensis]